MPPCFSWDITGYAASGLPPDFPDSAQVSAAADASLKKIQGFAQPEILLSLSVARLGVEIAIRRSALSHHSELLQDRALEPGREELIRTLPRYSPRTIRAMQFSRRSPDTSCYRTAR